MAKNIISVQKVRGSLTFDTGTYSGSANNLLPEQISPDHPLSKCKVRRYSSGYYYRKSSSLTALTKTTLNRLEQLGIATIGQLVAAMNNETTKPKIKGCFSGQCLDYWVFTLEVVSFINDKCGEDWVAGADNKFVILNIPAMKVRVDGVAIPMDIRGTSFKSLVAEYSTALMEESKHAIAKAILDKLVEDNKTKLQEQKAKLQAQIKAIDATLGESR